MQLLACIIRALAVVSLALPAINGGEAATFSKTAAALPSHGKLVLTCFELRDIGRGSGLALTLQTPSGGTYLYDAGLGARHSTDSDAPKQWPPILIDWDAGRDAILPFLKEQKISEIKGIVISHPHSDHYGGAFHLIQSLRVATLVDNGYNEVGISSEYRSLREFVQARHGTYRIARAGDRLDWGAGLEVEVLWPPRDLLTEKDIDLAKAIQDKLTTPNQKPTHFFPNLNSLVLRVRHGSNVFLLPGDIHPIGIDRMLDAMSSEKVKTTVLVAPGHGIHPYAKLPAATKPEIVVVSSLPRYSNSDAARVYGNEFGARVYLTYRHGRIRIVSDGERVAVETER